ncbi:MAG: serine hydrolase, partial [Armatimonadota bacterium]
GDPDRIYLMGHSAGAHLVALVSTDPAPLEEAGLGLSALSGTVVVDGAGIDLEAHMANVGGIRIFRDAFGEDPERWRQLSPMTYAAPDTGIPPMLVLVQGSTTRVAHSRRFADALIACGIEAEMVHLPDHTHASINRSIGKPDDPTTEAVTSFLAGLGETIGATAASAEPVDTGPFAPMDIEAAARYSADTDGARPPFAVGTIELTTLHDAARGKDLQVRITYPEAPGPFPVIVWCHGATGTKDMYQPLVRHWAGHGYVCLQANHSDSRAFETGAPGSPEIFVDWASRPKDVVFLLDSLDLLEARHDVLKGKLDETRIGVGGHSFGAHTAQLLAGATTTAPGERQSHADPRPLAFVLLSPQGIGEGSAGLVASSWDDVTRPFLVITGTNDSGRTGVAWEWRLDPHTYAASTEKHLLVIEGAHHGFGGVVGEDAFRNAGPENPAHLRSVQAASLALWDAYLKKSRDALDFLHSDAFGYETPGEAKLSRTLAQTPSAVEASVEAAPHEDAVWRDAARERDVPVRIYAPAGEGPFPAIVFSHGGGESREAFTYLGTHWAERGYVVVFLTHEGSDRAVIDAQEVGGLRAMQALAGPDAFHLRPEDVSFVLDRLLSDEPGSELLAGRVDPERVAMAGQCAGATTALAMVGLRTDLPGRPNATFTDPRFRCVIALSPQPAAPGGALHEGSWAHIEVPTLIVTGTRDFNWIPAVRQNPELVRMPYDGLPPGDKYLVEISGAEHNAFTDSVPYYPARERDPRHHAWIQAATTSFLDAYLRGDEAALARLQDEALEAETGGECVQESKLVTDAADRSGRHAVAVIDDLSLHDPERGEDRALRVTYPEAEGRFPAIIFCHAVRGSRHDFEPLVGHWASRGYVVLQMDHADTGRLGEDWRARAADVSFLIDSLDEIARSAPPLASRIDETRIGAGGHLIGAWAACALVGMKVFQGDEVEVCTDPRVDAALLLSPQGRGQGLTEESWAEIDRPMLVAAGSETVSRRTSNPARWRTEPYEFAGPAESYLLWVEGMDNDYAGLLRGTVQPETAGFVQDVTTAFWDAHLRGDREARDRLSDWPVSQADRERFQVEFSAAEVSNPPTDTGPFAPTDIEAAAQYSAENGGVSMLVMVDGEVVFEDYPNEGAQDAAWELASGTKSFCGVMAAAAVEDGLLELDEKVSDTITEWQGVAGKREMTIRQLLSLVGGQETGGEKGRVPTYQQALDAPLVAQPDERFVYGAVPFQVFGEVMRRKLGGSPLAYMQERIFTPIGLEHGRWLTHADGNPRMPSGAALTARDWAKLGELMRQSGEWEGEQVIAGELLDECLQPSPRNPCYGLTWWLVRKATREELPRDRLSHLMAQIARVDGVPDDLFLAGGAGGQRLYVSRDLGTVVVRQAAGVTDYLWRGKPMTFSDVRFIATLFGAATQ